MPLHCFAGSAKSSCLFREVKFDHVAPLNTENAMLHSLMYQAVSEVDFRWPLNPQQGYPERTNIFNVLPEVPVHVAVVIRSQFEKR